MHRLRVLPVETVRGSGVMEIKETVREELREVAWLASVVFSLSILGVSVAVVLALALHGSGAAVFGAV